MDDAALENTVHCARCDELLIKMFMNDHACDEEKLKGMIINSRGQLADPLSAAQDEEGPSS